MGGAGVFFKRPLHFAAAQVLATVSGGQELEKAEKERSPTERYVPSARDMPLRGAIYAFGTRYASAASGKESDE